MSDAWETLSEQRCFDGTQGFYRHHSQACNADMRVAVYQPPQATQGNVPTLFYLAGLTCTEETATIKAGAQRLASQLGLMLVMPDTSPRDTGIDGATGDWEFGEGASFYVDATQAPWSRHFRMHSYIAEELPALIAEHFPIDTARQGVFGHSMGGHGALVMGLRHPDTFRSVSAFSPIVAPTQVPWGQKAFPRFLGDDRATWNAYDACELIRSGHRVGGEILIDQGTADGFLKPQLQPERFESTCRDAGQPLRVRRHDGYDHSYYFVSSFIADHLHHHARQLDAHP